MIASGSPATRTSSARQPRPRAADTLPPLDLFFDFVSPYGWVGAEHIGAIAASFGRRVMWRPFLLKVTVRETMGLPPPLDTPLKGVYLMHDIKRTLRLHGLSLAANARFGFSSAPASRAVLWARAVSPQSVEPLILALYRAHWMHGRDISDTAAILDVVASLGLSRADAATALATDGVKSALRDETMLAIDRGVFGSPTIGVDDELFWGADRLHMIEKWLETGGW